MPPATPAKTLPPRERSTLPPPPPETTPGLLTPGNVAMVAILMAIEAVVLVALLRRVENSEPGVASRDLSRLEYVDLDPVTVPLKSGRAGAEATLSVRVEASILLTGDGAERARARDLVRSMAPRIADLVAKTISAETAEQAVDPGNRDRLKDRVRAALNEEIFKAETVREVVFRYYGP